MGKTGKDRHGMEQNGKAEGGKEKNERRKGTKERRQKMSGKAQKSTEKQDQQGFREDPQVRWHQPQLLF